MNTETRMPAIFFGHGSPMHALGNNAYATAWRRIGASVPRPKAILCVSAHWMTRGTAVTAMAKPETIHDFYGFPQALFDMQYPAPGDPALAARVRDVLAPLPVQLTDGWGLDHGTWSVLAHAFPKADVPVVQLSMDGTQGAAFHYGVGRRLAALRDEGVLIVGSGNVVHNLRMMARREGAPPFDWAVRFNDHIRGWLSGHDHAGLVAYEALGEDARLSAPTNEHFLPALYVAALQAEGESIAFETDSIDAGSLSMLSFVVGAGRA